jgi:hypothetical protein
MRYVSVVEAPFSVMVKTLPSWGAGALPSWGAGVGAGLELNKYAATMTRNNTTTPNITMIAPVISMFIYY